MTDVSRLTVKVELPDEIMQRLNKMQAELNALKGAIETVRLNNPYSLSCFTPVSDEDWARLNELLQREFGHTTDRYAAAVMCHAWDACARQIAEQAGIE